VLPPSRTRTTHQVYPFGKAFGRPWPVRPFARGAMENTGGEIFLPRKRKPWFSRVHVARSTRRKKVVRPIPGARRWRISWFRRPGDDAVVGYPWLNEGFRDPGWRTSRWRPPPRPGNLASTRRRNRTALALDSLEIDTAPPIPLRPVATPAQQDRLGRSTPSRLTRKGRSGAAHAFESYVPRETFFSRKGDQRLTCRPHALRQRDVRRTSSKSDLASTSVNPVERILPPTNSSTSRVYRC